MPGIDETPNTFRYRVQDPDKFDKFRVKPITQGVKITLGRVKGTNRWEIQSYIFDKKRFKDSNSVKNWLEKHLKSELRFFWTLKLGTSFACGF